MCEPTTLMAVATLATGAFTAYTQNQQGKANQQIAENNATLARADADATNAAATREQEQQSWRTRAMMGQQRAAIAANNLDPTLGTPADILGETALLGEIDQQTIRMNAARQAWGYEQQAKQYQAQGKLDRWGGRMAAGGTILSSLTSAYGQVAGGGGLGRLGGKAKIGPVKRERLSTAGVW